MRSAVVLLAAITALLTSSMVTLAAEPLFEAAEPIPSDAIVLFDGKDTSRWMNRATDGPAHWKVENGYMVVSGGDIRSRDLFADCQLHLEFWLPLMAEAQGQGRSNSGVFLMGWVYEIQILDSYGQTPTTSDCGAIYNIHPPMVNACRPPEQWQTFDIFFHAPRFDEAGKKTANARVSVLQNGIWIHENADIPNATPSPGIEEPKSPDWIQLQDHGAPVRFRNIWIRPLNANAK